jgi:hypothetical protein
VASVDDQGTQRLDDEQDGNWLPLAEASVQLGVSIKTARRRLKAGELVARQVSTAHGQAYEIWLPTNGAEATQTSTVNGVTTQRVDDATTLELVRLVDRLQRENMQLAGLVGSLQERNANLEAQLALPAPVTSTVPEIATGSPSVNVPVEPTQTSSEPSKRVPWWAPWRR